MHTDVIVIGAGLSGLVAARELETAGYDVILVDKGRSVGGRLATRRIQQGRVDHGAQFFTTRSEIFKKQVEQWLADDLVYIWGTGWSDGSIQHTKPDGHPRYAVRGGMNQLAQVLAADRQHVVVDTRVTDIRWQDDRWHVRSDETFEASGRVLVMTPPVPQSLLLLQNVPLTAGDRAALERIEYGACLAGLFVIDGTVDFPEPGAIQNPGQIMYWMADNQAKGISPDECIVTVHADTDYSREFYDSAEDTVLRDMQKQLTQYLGDDARVIQAQLKKWRYSVPLIMHPDDSFKAQNLPLICAGDAFGGRGRVEGAYLSGRMASEIAREILK